MTKKLRLTIIGWFGGWGWGWFIGLQSKDKWGFDGSSDTFKLMTNSIRFDMNKHATF
jgi:hypothetical protein